ncbi:MAG TPA: FAD:protein FMN transferase [Bacteroidales bacterium]|nr:FAD:protein FMN transferase [Bacteroidales bacterium]
MKKVGNQNSDRVHHNNAFLMNTSLDIILWGIDQETACDVTEKIFNVIKNLQGVLNRFDPLAEVYRVNQNAFEKEMVISPVLMQAVNQGVRDFYQTKGYFNIFAGDVYSSLKSAPGENVNLFATALLPEGLIEINKTDNSIRFLQKSVSLDFGGVGKGLALDGVSSVLDDFNIQNAFISFGGSSVLTKGHHPHGAYWPFSFRDNDVEGEVWPLVDDAVSVSSSKQGSGEVTHIFDPKTGRVETFQMAAVQCKSAAVAEVLSTALIASPQKEHQKIMGNYNVVRWELSVDR